MLISESYRRLNTELHRDEPAYGAGGKAKESLVETISAVLKAIPYKKVLDYGCGKGVVLNLLREKHPSVSFFGYDPAIADYQPDPPVCEYLYCYDVLEHIEPECLDEVLSHMASKFNSAAYLNISTIPAKKFLNDGRNAHLIVQNADWWTSQLSKHWEIASVTPGKKGVQFLVIAKNQVPVSQ